MNSHQSHTVGQPGGEDSRRCQICQEEIWESRWHAEKNSLMNRFICLFCYGKLHRSGKFKPASENKIELAVCDSCGESSEAIERTDTGWLCEGCME